MDPALESLLKNPPRGLQVWSACSAKQSSLEYAYQAFDGYEIEGSLFLNQFFNAFTKFGAGIPKPEDPVTLGPLADHVRDLTKAAALGIQTEVQTPFVAGLENENGAAYDAAEAPPPRFDIPKPGQFAPGGLADRKLVQEILKEIKLPPIRAVSLNESKSDDIDAIVPFSANALKGYEADYKSVRDILDHPDQHQLRVAVLHTVEILERHGRGEVRVGNSNVQVGTLREEFSGPTADDVKKSIELEQRKGPAAMFVELEEALTAMEKMRPLRAQETSKRWQAHYDYVLAMLSARFAYVNEYNLMLGKIRKDELPPLDPKLHKGWRLAAQEKMASPRDVKDKAEEAKKLFDQLIKEHPGTPWEVLAKRDRLTALGLSWQPTAVKN